jgi:hypothetical protein
LVVKWARVSVTVRIKSLKNCGIPFVVILAIVPFFICEKVVRAIRDLIKFLPSLKHLSLFFLISLRKGGRRSAEEVERGDVVKKFDSRLTMYVDSFLLESMTVSQ